VAGYLLDTSALSAYLNQDHPHHASAVGAINSLPSDAPKFVSAVTIGELQYGIRLAELAGSIHLTEYRARLTVIRKYALMPLTHHTADEYANLKSRLASQVLRKARSKMPRWIEDWIEKGSGKKLQIDENDLWICAQAKERDLTVMTNDDDMRRLATLDGVLRVRLTRD